MLDWLTVPSAGRGTERDMDEEDPLEFSSEDVLRFIAISFPPLDWPVDAEGGLGTLRLADPASLRVAEGAPCLSGARDDAVSALRPD